MTAAISSNDMPRIFIGTMNTRDFSQLEARLADDAVFDFPGPGEIRGRKRIIIFLKALLRKYPELAFTIEDTIAEEDRSCICWTNTGTNSRGEPYSNRGVTVVRTAGEKIVSISDYFKDTSFTKS